MVISRRNELFRMVQFTSGLMTTFHLFQPCFATSVHGGSLRIACSLCNMTDGLRISIFHILISGFADFRRLNIRRFPA
jgi:hypothetical protein